MKIESEDHYAEFSILEAPDWINIVALTPERDIVLVEQYRYGIEEPTLELPGGVSDPGETPFESSKRELMEETGYSSEEWISLGKVSSNSQYFPNSVRTSTCPPCRSTIL